MSSSQVRPLLANDFYASGVNATAYAAKSPYGYRIAIFNKGRYRDIAVAVDFSGARPREGIVWQLTGPGLEATSGVTLAGSSVAETWRQKTAKPVAIGDGERIIVPSGSACVLFAES